MKRKQRDHEYKLRAVTRDLNCYLNYIAYLDGVLKLVRCRRDKIKVSEKKGSIEYRMITKMKKLYEDALRFAPENYDVCVSYFLFCKRVKYLEPATAAVDRLLKVKQFYLQKFVGVTLLLCSCIRARSKRGI